MSKETHFYFIIEKGDPYPQGTPYFLLKSILSVGRAWRDIHPDISFCSPYISRHHIQIEYKKGCFYLTDLDSKHGTQINDKHISKKIPHEIKPGDRVDIAGGEAVLVFCESSERETISFPVERTKVKIRFRTERRTFYIDGSPVELSGNLYELFRVLFQKRGNVLSHTEIKKTVWPERECDEHGIPLVGEEEIATLIKRLRQKLGKHKDLISSIRGYGYIME